jgi:VCBS repeat-containing protein
VLRAATFHTPRDCWRASGVTRIFTTSDSLLGGAMTKHAKWIKLIAGGRGDDHLQGSAGKDVVIGHQGNDWLHGGAGNDLVAGDEVFGGKLWGWHLGGCWHASGAGNDTLDGGAGSDLVLGGRGNDFANYTFAENLQSHDVYDGGKGFDTLQLSLTYGEARLASVQEDIAAFQSFLECRADPRSDHGKTFHFDSFDLDARNFEALETSLVNAAPTARADAFASDEDTPLRVAAPGVLANDTDADHLDVLAVTGADTLSSRGATVVVGTDGSITYDAGSLFQYLAAGESAMDSFSYQIEDLGGAAATATVRVAVAGVNDEPVAGDDSLAPAGGGGQAQEQLITFEGASNAADVDGYAFAGFYTDSMFGINNSWMAATYTKTDTAGGDFDADGAIKRVDGQDFALKSLAIAALMVEPDVIIKGYNDGKLVDGASVPLGLNAVYKFIQFGAAWAGVDEVRFYGSVRPDLGVEGDWIAIDNVLVSSGSDGASGYSEDAPLDINVADLLSNDDDVDASDVLHVSGVSAKSAMGAAIRLNDDGTLRYDPTQADEIQALGAGETATDTFEYTVSDGNGGTDVATVSIELLGAADADLLF